MRSTIFMTVMHLAAEGGGSRAEESAYSLKKEPTARRKCLQPKESAYRNYLPYRKNPQYDPSTNTEPEPVSGRI